MVARFNVKYRNRRKSSSNGHSDQIVKLFVLGMILGWLLKYLLVMAFFKHYISLFSFYIMSIGHDFDSLVF